MLFCCSSSKMLLWLKTEKKSNKLLLREIFMAAIHFYLVLCLFLAVLFTCKSQECNHLASSVINS